MEKILKLLEKNVQWGILALGALFLLYMIWSYVYLNPAARQMPGHPAPVAPGMVDKLVADGSATSLEQRMRQTHPEFHIDVNINAHLDLGGATTQPIADSQPVWNSWQIDVNKVIPPLGGFNQSGPVQALASLPPLKYLDQEPLRTVVLVNSSTGQPVHKDLDSVTTFWSLPVADLARAYQAAFSALPQQKRTAQIIRTVLVRQEQTANGEWTNEETVPFPFNAPTPPTYPEAGNPQSLALAQPYLDWVNTADNAQWFVAPTFPTLAYTDRPDLQWQPLETWVNYRAKEQAIQALPVTDVAPTAPVGAAVGSPPGITTFGGGPNGRGGFGGALPGAARPSTANPVAGPQSGRGQSARAGGGAGARGAAGAAQPPVTPVPTPAPIVNPFAPVQGGQTPQQTAPIPEPVVNVPPVVVPKLQVPPAGAFTPSSMASQDDIGIYLNDLTAEPGKTYRYKVRYTLLNPIYGDANQAPKLAAQFGIDSADSAWSDSVVIPPRARFWCMARQPLNLGTGEVAFTVFSWHDGLWQQKNYSASAGDEIGANEGDTGDFLSHWTLLDVNSLHATVVLLAPDDGSAAQQRSIAADTTSQDYKRFMRDFNAQLQPNNGAAPAPGVPGAPSGPGIAPAGAVPGNPAANGGPPAQ